MTQKLSCSLREYRYIVKYAFPINANQTVLHLLEGAEAILIPAILCMHGLTKDNAISQFGILTGMALPLVLFPCTAANSFALTHKLFDKLRGGRQNWLRRRNT